MVDFFAGMIPTAQQLDDTALVGTVVCQLRQNVQQPIPNVTPTPMTWDTEDYDLLGGHSTVTNPDRYTCQREGWYLLTGGVTYTGNTGGTYRACRWRQNGSDLNASQVISPQVNAGTVATIVVARPYITYMVVGDYVQLCAEHNIGGSLNTSVLTVSAPNMQVAYAGLPN